MKTMLLLNMASKTEINRKVTELEKSEFAKRLYFDAPQEQTIMR